MDDGLLSLKWNNHRSTFFHVLADLREKSQYSDVTLACDGELFPTHKLVLSTCSDYFASMLETTSCKAPIIVLKDVKKEHLTSLLRYMYLGEAEVRQSDLSGLIKAAECLRIKGLAVPDRPPDESPMKSSVKKSRDDSASSPPPSRKRARRDSGNSSSAGKVSSSRHVNSDSQVPSVPREQTPPPPIKTECLDICSPPRVEPEEQFSVDDIKLEQEHEEVIEDRLSNISDMKGDGGLCDIPVEGSGDDTTGDVPSYQDNGDNKLDQNQLELDQVPGPSRERDDRLAMSWQGDDSASFPHDLFDSEDMTQQQMIADSCSRMMIDSETPPVETQHDSELLKCSECCFVTDNAVNYQLHINKHYEEKQYKCPMCDYVSFHQGNFKHHIRVHTGEKPFQCPYCDYNSTHKSSLNRHMRIHTGEKPFQCSYCHYSCTHRSGLNRHMRRHTGEKPFKCTFCEYSCIQKCSLNSHMKKHFPEQISQS